MSRPFADPCDWLPALVLFRDSGGDWHRYLDVLYGHFCRDFKHTQPNFLGRRWAVRRHPETDGKEFSFWHLISGGPVEADRLTDFRRTERICWPRPMIDQHRHTRLRWWRNRRTTKNHGTRNHLVIAVEDFSYVVVLDERSDKKGPFVMLVTAYHVEFAHRRKSFEREWAAAKAAGQGG